MFFALFKIKIRCMAIESIRHSLKYIFSEAGFKSTRRCYLNYRFALAMLAGVIVVWVMHSWVKPYPESVEYSWMQLLSLILWQPFIEEVLFRGIIQTQDRLHYRRAMSAELRGEVHDTLCFGRLLNIQSVRLKAKGVVLIRLKRS